METSNSKFKKFSLKEICQEWPDLIKTSYASESVLKTQIEDICPIESPKPQSLIFISEPTDKMSILFDKSPLTLVLPLNTKEEELKKLNESQITTLLSPNPKLAMALIGQKYLIKPRIQSHFAFGQTQVHPTALIHPSAEISSGCQIGPYSVIGPNCKIGDNSKIASHVTMESNVTLGDSCTIFSHVSLGQDTVMGDFCLVQSQSCIGSDGFGYATSNKGEHFGIPHTGLVRLGNHVHIGAGTQIDRGTFGETVIGDFTKIDNLVHIAHNCKIGKSCLLTAGFLMAGSSEIGNYFVTGGATVVTGHIKITDHVQIAGLSCVQKSITKPGKYGGYPIKPLAEHLKTTATSAKLVEFRKDLNKVLKHLNINSEEGS